MVFRAGTLRPCCSRPSKAYIRPAERGRSVRADPGRAARPWSDGTERSPFLASLRPPKVSVGQLRTARHAQQIDSDASSNHDVVRARETRVRRSQADAQRPRRRISSTRAAPAVHSRSEVCRTPGQRRPNRARGPTLRRCRNRDPEADVARHGVVAFRSVLRSARLAGCAADVFRRRVRVVHRPSSPSTYASRASESLLRLALVAMLRRSSCWKTSCPT